MGLETKLEGEQLGVNIIDLMSTPDINRPEIIGSWFTESNLCLIYGMRGCGKSTFAMGLALAAANGCEFLNPEWKPARQYRVLYLDSEMDHEGMKRKLREVDSASKISIQKTPLRVVSPEDMGGSAWNLSERSKQDRITNFLIQKKVDVLIIDNLLGFSGPAYKGDDEISIWKRIEDWLLPLRRLGKSIIIIHHSSKSGDQYGTIKKENPCDTVIRLEQIVDPWINGIAINWHFTKGRWIYGESRKSLRITYEKTLEGQQRWSCRSLDEANKDLANRYLKMGWKAKDIAATLNLTPSEVSMMTSGKELFPSPPKIISVQEDLPYDEFDS